MLTLKTKLKFAIKLIKKISQIMAIVYLLNIGKECAFFGKCQHIPTSKSQH